jgi:prepilin-type processing-associated H-X9-DG protein
MLAFDMHSNLTSVDVNAESKPRSPYSPYSYQGTNPGLVPNTSQTWQNTDYIRDCPFQNTAGVDGTPCTKQTPSRQAAAPRSLHTGGVNASHVDGSVIFINDDIEMHLMARMVCGYDGQGLIEGEQKK